MNFQVLHFDSVTSTQDIGRMLLRENVVIVAEEQRNGRGRRGRKWISPVGGLWMTVILKSEKNAHILPLLASVVVAKALDNLGVKCCLKWPNDILVEGKKVAGILGEIYDTHVLLGIGVNLQNEIPPELKEIATNLPMVNKEKLLMLILELLENTLSLTSKTILEEWRKYQCTLGRKVVIEDDGTVGVAMDIDENGFLIISTENGFKKIKAGTLRFME